MPFKSKKQQRWMFAAENRGELKKGTAKRWAHETKSIKSLPEKVKKRKRYSGSGIFSDSDIYRGYKTI